METGSTMGDGAGGCDAAAWAARVIGEAFAGGPLVALKAPIADPLRAIRERVPEPRPRRSRPDVYEMHGQRYAHPIFRDDFFEVRARGLPDLRTLVEDGAVGWADMRRRVVLQLSASSHERDEQPDVAECHVGLREKWLSSLGEERYADLGIPREVGDADLALLLVATGAVQGRLPLRLVMALEREAVPILKSFGLGETAWAHAIVPLSRAVDPDWFGVVMDREEQSLVVRGRRRGSPSVTPLAPLFDERAECVRGGGAGPWGYLLPDQRTVLVGAGRCDDRKELAEGAAAHGYELRWVDEEGELLDEVGREVARARTGAAVPDTVAGAVVRGILSAYRPLTGKLPALGEGDEEMHLSPAECLDWAMPELAELGSSAVRGEAHGAVAKLLASLAQMKRGWRPDGVVWPGGVKHAWRFKFRTRDHTWIVGEIFRTAPPGRGGRPVPLELPPDERSGCTDVYRDSELSDWFGTPALRCRVREQRT